MRCFRNPYNEDAASFRGLSDEVSNLSDRLSSQFLAKAISDLRKARKKVDSLLAAVVGDPVTVGSVRQLGLNFYNGPLAGFGFSLMRLGQALHEGEGGVLIDPHVLRFFNEAVDPLGYDIATMDNVTILCESTAEGRMEEEHNPSLLAYLAAEGALQLCLKLHRVLHPGNNLPTFTFLCSHIGVQAAVIAVAERIATFSPETLKAARVRAPQPEKMAYLLEDMCKALEEALDQEEVDEDELLYGRAGILFSLGWVVKNAPSFTNGPRIPELIQRYCSSILNRGFQNAKAEDRHPDRWPLYYTWHRKPYLGAAHGIAGILHVLHICSPFITDPSLHSQLRDSILSCTQPLLSRQLKSTGNFSTRMVGPVEDDGKLYHWCHGAPGVTFTLFDLLELQPSDEAVLMAIRESLDAIWMNGLLKKGAGLCHGISGNGYLFLKASVDGEEQQLNLARAVAYARFASDHLQELLDVPDSPWSLFEGVLGHVCFLLDVSLALAGEDFVGFPGFEL
ncbi:LanC-like protein 2 [Dinochytrium kinnereticum]|nr:LanC-like protein 2 [Dinochytrium kinnereticum]